MERTYTYISEQFRRLFAERRFSSAWRSTSSLNTRKSGEPCEPLHLFGLIVRQFTRRGPVWKSEDRVQIGVARSKRSETHWFSRPRLIDRLPLPLDWPSHISDVSNRARRLNREPRQELGKPRPWS